MKFTITERVIIYFKKTQTNEVIDSASSFVPQSLPFQKLLPPLLECLSDRDALTRMAALNACVGVEAQLRGKDEWMVSGGIGYG